MSRGTTVPFSPGENTLPWWLGARDVDEFVLDFLRHLGAFGHCKRDWQELDPRLTAVPLPPPTGTRHEYTNRCSQVHPRPPALTRKAGAVPCSRTAPLH